MSVVPNDNLQSVDSLDLITFPITERIDATGIYTRDFWTRYKGFWKQVIIRNYNIADNLLYRINPNEVQKVIPPASERTVQGWGSFLQCITTAGVPDVEVSFTGVTQINALRKNGKR